MKISSINFLNYTNRRYSADFAPKKTNELKQDTFEKSNNVSFCGREFYTSNNQLKRIPKTPKNVGFLSNLYNIATGMLDFMGLSSYKEECEAEAYINLFTSNRQTRNRLKSSMNERIETFNSNYIYAAVGSLDSITKTVTKTGITTCAGLENFLKQYNDTPNTRKIFSGQVVEAMSIFCLLNNKQHLSKYGEIALYLYNEEADKKEPDFEKINRYTKFLDSIGAKDTKNFEEKFAHLKADFNNFEDSSDKIDAIEYLIDTYDDKIKLLTPYLNSGTEAKKVYSDMAGVIDTLYKKNNGKSLGNLGSFINSAISGGRLKNNTERIIAPVFNDFKTPNDLIDFYEIISECGADIKDLNKLLSKGIISDIDPVDNLLNCEDCLELIQNKGYTKEEANRVYFDFKDPINAYLKEEENKQEKTDRFLDIIEENNIKNANSLLEFYNKTTGVKKKYLTTKELKEFLDGIELKQKEEKEEAKEQDADALKIKKFVSRYKDENNGVDNLYKFIENLPDEITLDEATAQIKTLNNCLGKINLVQRIDNSNILNIDIDFITKKRKLNAYGINCLANEVLGAEDEKVLFVSNLSGAYKESKKEYPAFRIAREIASKAGKTEESYQNLIRLLKLDRESLEVDKNASDYIYTRAIEQNLPCELIEFVNSDDWLNFKNDETKIPDFSLHAKLRLTDRYALSAIDDINSLYTDETKEKLKNIIKSIYQKAPDEIKTEDKMGAVVVDTDTLGIKTEIVFSNDGKVITIVPCKK